MAVSRSATRGPVASVQLASPRATSAWRSAGSAGRRDGDGRVVRRVGQRAPHLLEEHRLLEKAEARAAVCSPRTDTPVQPNSARSAHVRLRVHREIGPRLRAELLLLGREREVHQRDLGRPSTRSAMMFRRISVVPGLDRVAATSELEVLPVAAVGCVLREELRVGAEQLERDLRHPLVRLRPLQLDDRRLGAGRRRSSRGSQSDR